MREHLLRMLNEAMEARQDINAMVPQHKKLEKNSQDNLLLKRLSLLVYIKKWKIKRLV